MHRFCDSCWLSNLLKQESHDHIGDGLRAVGWLTGDARLYFNFSSDYCDDAGPLNVVQGHPSLLFLLVYFMALFCYLLLLRHLHLFLLLKRICK
ncbi:Fer-1-like protein [Dirofilaria immitis]